MKLTLILAAVIPAVILLVQVYRADRLEKEPIPMLLGLVLCGVIAAELASLVERAGVWLLELALPERGGQVLQPALGGAALPQAVQVYQILLYFGVVALTEEGIKYLLLKLRTWRSPQFDCSFDGVVYAVFLSLGFALWENIQYVLAFGFSTALARAVTAVPGHACFGVFMGTWYGLAKRWSLRGREARSRLERWLAFLVPVLLHGLYDYIAASPQDLGWVFLAFVLLLFFSAVRVVRHMATNDDYLTREELDFRE